jgi:Beta-lactamase enzyme family
MKFCFFCLFFVQLGFPSPAFESPGPIAPLRTGYEKFRPAALDSVIGPQADSSFLEDLLRQYPDYFDKILQGRDSLQVQIIYTRIDRDGANNPSFTDYFFNVHPDRYFYPASTVKLPIAVLALQKINELRLPGLSKNSSMITEAAYGGQTAVLNDPTTPDGRPAVAQYIKKILLVSDNDAFNRLYEFLGQAYINDQLHKMGYADVQILHRLEIAMTPDENRHSNPVDFYDLAGRLLYQQPMQFCDQAWEVRHDSAGRGYYNGQGQLINHAMDFSGKNRISLVDLHQILLSVLFPSAVPPNQRFNLKDEDYEFLHQYLSQYPSETKFPSYDTAQCWDAFCKFLYWGSEKGPLPKNIRIFNKIGDAYGYLTDVAYIVDFDRHIEFMLSASIYCNRDGILNDDQYDYDSVGLPFLKQLGRVIYDYETKRPRDHSPGLLSFRMKYDK